MGACMPHIDSSTHHENDSSLSPAGLKPSRGRHEGAQAGAEQCFSPSYTRRHSSGSAMWGAAADPPAPCGQPSCSNCWGDVVVCAQRRAVVQALKGKQACFDSTLTALQEREHLLSDLEVTLLLLLAHGAPLSIDLGEHAEACTPSSSHMKVRGGVQGSEQYDPRATVSPTTELNWHGWPAAQAGSSGDGPTADASYSTHKWRLAPAVPATLHGVERAVVTSCACNSWPLVAAFLAFIPSDAPLHEVCKSSVVTLP
jgi:hypothetical protein